VEGNHRGDADREQPSEGIARILRDPYPAPENDEIEEEQNRAANEAEFLAHNGEDKVRMVLGQEVQLTLCAAEKPLAKEHARANRNLRLDDVIARAERIDVRIHKHHDAHFLVILEKMPKHRHRCKSRGEDAKEKAQSYPRRKDHAEKDRQKDERRTEIRLLQNEKERNADIRRHGDEVHDGVNLIAFFDHGGKRDDHDEFGELRRLYADRAERNPTLRTECRLSDEHDKDEQHEIEHVEVIPITLQNLIVKVHQKRCKGNIDDDRDTLPLNEPIAFLTRCVDMGCTADDDETHDDNRRSRENQRDIRTAQKPF